MDLGESGRIHFTEQTDREFPVCLLFEMYPPSLQGWMLSVTLFLVALNGILGELGNRVDGSLFAHNLTIYITTKFGKWHLEHYNK